jgi:hypothetical protein
MPYNEMPATIVINSVVEKTTAVLKIEKTFFQKTNEESSCKAKTTSSFSPLFIA